MRNAAKTVDGSVMKANASTVDPARCFLRLANLPISYSIVLAAMKRPFRAKPAESFTRSKYWIAANRRRERAQFHIRCGEGLSCKENGL